jgi:hypothetical protein
LNLRNNNVNNSFNCELIFKGETKLQTVLGEEHFLLNVPIFSSYPKSCYYSCYQRNTALHTASQEHIPVTILVTASLADTSHDGAHPCSLGWWWGWKEQLNIKQNYSGPEMSGGREPRLKDINKLQVFRDLPAAL